MISRLRGGVLLGLVVLLASWAGAAVASGATPTVRLRVLRLVDRTRRAHFRDGTVGPRVLVTDVRYPARGDGPFPLVVFAHGFALTPDVYARLLDTWARAGYVVAAPVFPVESAGARGGSDRSDLPNEPGDIRFVISRLVATPGPLPVAIDRRKIAVAGQSDGAVAAFSAAYDARFRDRRIRAAVILSGATLGGFTAPAPGSPPLFASQGTLDPLNAPGVTAAYFRLMHRPKFLLWLIGATHLPPYTTDDRWAAVVGRATTAFLDHYLRGRPLDRVTTAGSRPGVARITADA